MYKRGKINTDWKLRTFVLTARQLAYFKGGVRNRSYKHSHTHALLVAYSIFAVLIGLYHCSIIKHAFLPGNLLTND